MSKALGTRPKDWVRRAVAAWDADAPTPRDAKDKFKRPPRHLGQLRHLTRLEVTMSDAPCHDQQAERLAALLRLPCLRAAALSYVTLSPGEALRFADRVAGASPTLRALRLERWRPPPLYPKHDEAFFARLGASLCAASGVRVLELPQCNTDFFDMMALMRALAGGSRLELLDVDSVWISSMAGDGDAENIVANVTRDARACAGLAELRGLSPRGHVCGERSRGLRIEPPSHRHPEHAYGGRYITGPSRTLEKLLDIGATCVTDVRLVLDNDQLTPLIGLVLQRLLATMRSVDLILTPLLVNTRLTDFCAFIAGLDLETPIRGNSALRRVQLQSVELPLPLRNVLLMRRTLRERACAVVELALRPVDFDGVWSALGHGY